jgi:hypothetical protein
MQKVIIGTVTFILASASVPIIPEELQFQYAYTRPCVVAPDPVSPTSTAPVKETYQPSCTSGEVSVAVFIDKKGNEVYSEIPDVDYKKMGELNGALNNPKKDQLVPLIDSLTAQQAQAAIALDATSTATCNPCTSLTFAHTVSGSNRTLVVGIQTGGDTSNGIYSVAYNGASSTMLAKNFIVSPTDPIWLFQHIAPTTGTNNIVIDKTGSGFISAFATSYTGVNQAITGSTTNSCTGCASLTTSTTTTADNSVIVLVGSDYVGFNAALTNGTIRAPAPAATVRYIADRGPVSPAGAYSILDTRSAGDNIHHIITILAPYIAPTSVSVIQIINDVTLDGDVSIGR